MRVKATNKTTICSIVFLDIVEYTKKSVAEQIKLKNRFNSLISQAIKHVPITDRIILDTGDGAAISFLGDPEDALLCAIKLRDSLLASPPEEMQFFARIGINLGPVRLVQDLNQQSNMIGDGINVAQRVMSFAKPNQVLVSRSFHEVISCMTDEYAKLFEYQGALTDKHVREHEIYAIKNQFNAGDVISASSRHHREEKNSGEKEAGGPAQQAHWWNDKNILLKRIMPLAIILVLSVAAVLRVSRAPSPPPLTVETTLAVPESSPQAASTPVAKAVPKATAALRTHAAQKPRSEQAFETKTGTKKTETAEIVFKIIPWGEVFIDGKSQGVSPPLKVLKVEARAHLIEVKNSIFPSWSQTIEPKAGEQVIIKYKFQ